MASTTSMDKLENYSTDEEDAPKKDKLSRRSFVKLSGGAALSAAAIMVGPKTFGSNEIAAQDVAMTDQLTRSPSVYEGRENQNPDKFCDMTEGELEDFFQLSSETTSAENYSEKFVDLFGTALNLGCTAEEIEEFLALDANEPAQEVYMHRYLAKMDAKYTYPVFVSLFKYIERSEATNGTDDKYNLFRDARRAVGARFLSHARKTHNLNETAVVNMVGHEESVDHGDGSFGVSIDLDVTNDVGDRDASKSIYRASGKISAQCESRYGRIITNLEVHEPWNELFEELSEKLAA